jgi:hypothetical protein
MVIISNKKSACMCLKLVILSTLFVRNYYHITPLFFVQHCKSFSIQTPYFPFHMFWTTPPSFTFHQGFCKKSWNT